MSDTKAVEDAVQAAERLRAQRARILDSALALGEVLRQNLADSEGLRAHAERNVKALRDVIEAIERELREILDEHEDERMTRDRGLVLLGQVSKLREKVRSVVRDGKPFVEEGVE